MSANDRYTTTQKYGNVEFSLSDYLPDIEECRFLFLKTIEQAVRDYVSLEDTDSPNSSILWEQARDFIFDDEYTVDWGDKEMSITDILDILDIDINWFRMRTSKRYEEKKNARKYK